MGTMSKINLTNSFLLLVVLWISIKWNRCEELNLAFQQDDYQVKFERIELIRYNKDFVKAAKLVTFKYNRTAPVVNLTFTPKINFSNEVTTIIQVYKFMSNEYRFFPIHFAANVCKGIKADVGGVKSGFMRCGNCSTCPYLKEKTYHVCNWYPDPAKLPPFIPDGQYKIELQFIRNSQELGLANIYGAASRAIA